MPNREYYLAQAETCIKLAAASPTPSAAARLIAMAEEFRAKGGHIDDEFVDPFALNGNAAHSSHEPNEPEDDPRAG